MRFFLLTGSLFPLAHANSQSLDFTETIEDNGEIIPSSIDLASPTSPNDLRVENSRCGDDDDEFDFSLKLRADGYAEETSWSLTDQYGSLVASKSEGEIDDKLQQEFSKCLPHGCYTFTISDSFGDGISQHTNNGSYKGFVNGIEEFHGGQFLSHSSNAFCTGEFFRGCADGGSSFEFKLDLKTDVFGSEVAWDVRDFTNRPIIYQTGPFPPSHKDTVIATLPGGCYSFNLYDTWGDGFCCSHGNGEATGYIDGSIHFHVRSFGSVFTNSFCNCGDFPSTSPSFSPTYSPTNSPTSSPTGAHSKVPTSSPSVNPSVSPTNTPTLGPSVSPSTSRPTLRPTLRPTKASPPPTASPTDHPSSRPSHTPTVDCGTNNYLFQLEKRPTIIDATDILNVYNMDKEEDAANNGDVEDGAVMVPVLEGKRARLQPATTTTAAATTTTTAAATTTRDGFSSSVPEMITFSGGCYRKGCYTLSFLEDGDVMITNEKENEAAPVSDTELIGYVDGTPVEIRDSYEGNGRKTFCSTGCEENEFFFEFEVMTDKWSNETYWQLRDSAHMIVVERPSSSYPRPNSLYTESQCLVKGCYTFYIYDTWGDGFCCDYGDGNVEAFADGKSIFNITNFNKIYGMFFCG